MRDATVDLISEYAASLTSQDVGPGAVHAVKRSLIDSVGCALGAYGGEPVEIARRIAARVHCDRPASALGTSMKTSPEMAAFVNGSAVRYLDFSDDYLKHDGPHPSDNICAVLAACESVNASGKDLVRGIALAYEIVGQLVDHATFKSQGWDHVTETSIGSSLACGNVFGLSKERMSHCLSLAIAPNIALYQTRVGEISMWKGCAGPNAARNGLFAAILAAEGMTGPKYIIEGRTGLWNKVTGPFKLGTFGGKNHPFKVERTFFKPRPSMYMAILPADIAFELHREVNVDTIESIRIYLDQFSVAGSSGPEKFDPQTRETADHSIPYLVVAGLVDGEITEKSFTPERYRNEKVLALLKRTSMHEDKEYTEKWPYPMSCRIEITDKSGKVFSRHGANAKGHPDNPMSDAEIETKFLNLVRKVLTPARATEALRMLWRTEELESVSKIFDAVRIRT